MYTKRRVQSLQHFSSKTFCESFIKSIINSIITDDQEVNENILHDQIQYFKTILLQNSSWPVHEDLFSGIIYTLNKHHTWNKTLQNSKYRQKVLANLTEIVTFLKISEFYTAKFPNQMINCIFPYLYNMNQLKLLEITSISPAVKDSYLEEMIIKGISNMSNLESFTFTDNCTDTITEVLQLKCPKLIYFSGEFSLKLTNQSIFHLMECKNLKSIELNYTCVDEIGFSELLKARPDLRNIGKHEAMKKILRNLSDLQTNEFHLSILTLHISRVKTKHLQIIAQLCPKLKSLEVSCNNADVSVLQNLVNLENLGLVNTTFSKVQVLLESTGKCIKNLKFSKISDIDLTVINRLCPDLNYLMIDQCSFKMISPKLLQDQFNHLEYLICGEKFSLHHMVFLLSTCKYLKQIGLSDKEKKLNDNFFLNILERNPLTKLEELNLDDNNLSLKSVSVLVNNCKSLRKLSGLNKCNVGSEEDLKNFMLMYPHLDFETFDSPFFVFDIMMLPK